MVSIWGVLLPGDHGSTGDQTKPCNHIFHFCLCHICYHSVGRANHMSKFNVHVWGLCLLSCSGRSHDGGRGRGVGDNSSLEHGKGQGPWMVVGAHLAAPWNVEVQRTSSRKPGRELALIRSSVMPVPECQLASLYVMSPYPPVPSLLASPTWEPSAGAKPW